MTNQDLTKFCVDPSMALSEVIKTINNNSQGAALVTGENNLLIGMITDGDIRRHILAGGNLSASASNLLAAKNQTAFEKPVTVSPETPQSKALELMQELNLRHIPVVNEAGQFVDLYLFNELTQEYALPMNAIVMAGGFGKRLRPITEHTPKPMLTIGDRPVIELTLDRLRNAGIRNVKFTLHHQAGKVTEHFGDGKKFGMDVDYVIEDQPLGTAGALRLIERPKETVLVINGDIITDVSFREMLAFHQDHQAMITVGARHYEVEVPYGVIETEGVSVRALVEKPRFDFFVNAGIYLLEPKVYDYLPESGRIDMPDLISSLLADQQRVINFPIFEYWLDIGKPDDYERAQNDFENGRFNR